MIVQLTRKDWEEAGPYSDPLSCPMSTALKRVLGFQVDFMWSSIKQPGGSVIGSISPRFTSSTYLVAREAYNRGEEVLFEATLKLKSIN